MARSWFDKWLDSKTWEGQKERRKKYIGAKAIDSTCRNHGSCDWCKGNRLHSSKRRAPLIEEQELEWPS